MGRMDSKAPRWATVCLVAGALLMVLSGGGLVTSQALVARYAGAVQTEDLFGDGTAGDTPAAASDVEGPLNLLLVGIDPREPTTPPLADSIMVVHIPKGLNGAYVFSIPRDTYVEIPAFPKAGYQGGHGKINGAMAMGSHVTGQQLPSAVQGFELLSKTITKLTGIRRFDAGAIINFEGFKKVVDAMGGVDLYVDERTRSEHLAPDGSRRPYRPRYRGDEHPYTGPQKVYEVGQHHLKGWEALDFIRQRYGLKGTDYGRQRHQQQFLKAMAEQALSADVVTNPVKLDKVLTAAGKSLTFNGRGRSVVDFAFALKGLRPGEITMIKLKGGGLMDGGRYQGEQLQAGTEELFAAVAQDRVGEFLLNHPEFINRTK
jgi:polyisoprenyl-teichoic acid--peptidoglycan teichoic acid transferase